MQAELEALEKALGTPKRPVCAVVGGAKVSTKLELLGNLVGKVDKLIIGGGMANTFLYAAGHQGRQVAVREGSRRHGAAKSSSKAEQANCTVLLPIDVVVAGEFKASAPHKVVDVDACPDDQMILDVGPQSVALYQKEVERLRDPGLERAARRLRDRSRSTTARWRWRKAVAELTADGKLLSVAGGGDTVAALPHAGVEDKFSYVSTAGGAFLEWMEGKTLPGVAALIRAA